MTHTRWYFWGGLLTYMVGKWWIETHKTVSRGWISWKEFLIPQYHQHSPAPTFSRTNVWAPFYLSFGLNDVMCR